MKNGKYETLIESKIWNERCQTTDIEKKKKKNKSKKKPDTIFTLYNKVCNHFGFEYNYKDRKTPHSVNIVYNIKHSPPSIYIIAARKCDVQVRRITMTSDFTRIGRVKPNLAKEKR